ncbi:hypothetical protein Tco_0538028 [Tanacetum coccineum]
MFLDWTIELIIEAVTQETYGKRSEVKVKAHLNLYGIVFVDSAQSRECVDDTKDYKKRLLEWFLGILFTGRAVVSLDLCMPDGLEYSIVVMDTDMTVIEEKLIMTCSKQLFHFDFIKLYSMLLRLLHLNNINMYDSE